MVRCSLSPRTPPDLEVGPSGPWTDLQLALDVASDGDTVLIHGPQWSGSYVAAHDVTIAAYPGDVVTLVPDGSAGLDRRHGRVSSSTGVQVGVVGLTLDGSPIPPARVTNGGVLSTGARRCGTGSATTAAASSAGQRDRRGRAGERVRGLPRVRNGGAVALLAGSSLLFRSEARFARNSALNGAPRTARRRII